MTLLLPALIVSASLMLQERVLDLSGAWVYVPRAAAAADEPESTRPRIVPARENPSLGREFLARQSALVLTIERTFDKARSIAEYRLDGSDSRNKEAMFETVSTVSIREGRMTIVTAVPALSREGQDDAAVRRVLWIDSDGRLQVDVTVGGVTQRSTYSRKPPQSS